MPEKFSWKIYFFLAVLLGIATASAAPLDVKKTEVVELFAQQQSDYSFSYSNFNVTGFINITNSGSDDLSDIWVAINLTNDVGGLSLYYNGSSSNVLITTSAATASAATNGNINTSANYFVHIPLLRAGETVSLYYDVDDSKVGIPILVDESYSVSKIPANTQQTWRVYFNLSLNTSALPGGVTTVDVNVTKYLSNQSANFGSSNWSTLGPITDAATTEGTATIWDGPYTGDTLDALNVTGIILTPTAPKDSITFNVTGVNTNSQRDATLEPFGFATIFFRFDDGVSGTSIVDVFASGPATIAATKEGPVINSSGTWWNESVNITNTAQGVAYLVRNVSLWAVNTTTGFPNMNAVIPGSWHDFTPGAQINPGASWYSGKFTFENSVVPVVWANMTLKLIKDQSQGWWAVNSTTQGYNSSYGSDYIVVEKILVIGTYLVKATKHVIPNGTTADYDIYIVVENIGSNVTPTYLYIYDMVPNNFSVVPPMGVNKSEMLAVDALPADDNWNYSGKNGTILPSAYAEGYYWTLYALNPGADGDGSYTNATEIANNQSVVIHYQVNGTGDFRLTDAFIVGIDPTFSMNAQTTPKITIVSGSAARNYENLFAIATAAVLVGTVLQRRKR